jgi:hypothetical protein
VKRRGKGGPARVEATWRKKEGDGVGVGVRWVGIMDRRGTDAAAPGCSDSGVRCTLRGHGGTGLQTGAATGAGDSPAGG